MTRHRISAGDGEFRDDMEAGRIAPGDFGHRSRVQLAYIYLAEDGTEAAYGRMRDTLTRAWILAVRHFMERSAPCASADEFIDRNPLLLDSRVMLTHYSAGLLFSDEARGAFQEPDLDPIPRHGPAE